MENKREEPYSDFAKALRKLLDGTKLFERSDWARILHVSESAISHWVTDENIPRPENLRAILDSLAADPRVSDHVLEDFEKLLTTRPAREISPHGRRMTPTIEHYMLKPLREAFLRALSALPPWLQDRVLRETTERCWQLRENPPARPTIHERQQGRFRALVTSGLRQASHDERTSLSNVTTTILHETKTCLTSLYLALGALSRETLTERGKKAADQAFRTAEELSTTIERLRGLTRYYDKRTFDSVDINEIIKSAIALPSIQRNLEETAKTAPIAIDLRLTPVSPVVGNRDALQTLLVNLVLNAIEAMPQGGQLRITTDQVGDHIRTQVTDTGVGVPPQAVENIFEPFFTTKAGGTGLGLAIVSEIIKQHGGEVRLAGSWEGKGTTFEVKLPASIETKARQEKRLLVVDDDPGLLNALKLHLTTSYEDVTFCQDPMEALQKIREKKFDIILADWKMPGVSGDEIARAVKKLSPGTRVILITGYATKDLVSEYWKYGFDALVQKPFKYEELEKILTETARN